jgi:hypothetical protein
LGGQQDTNDGRPMTEHQMKDKFAVWLRRRKAKGDPLYFLKIHGSNYQRSGVADYWLVVGGSSVQIEMKAPGRPCKGTKLQEKELRDHVAAEGYSFVSNNLDACKDIVLAFLGLVGPDKMMAHMGEGRIVEFVA